MHGLTNLSIVSSPNLFITLLFVISFGNSFMEFHPFHAFTHGSMKWFVDSSVFKRVPHVSQSRHCLSVYTADMLYCVTQQAVSVVSHGRQFLLCYITDIVRCVAEQTFSVVSLSYIVRPLQRSLVMKLASHVLSQLIPLFRWTLSQCNWRRLSVVSW